MNGSTPHTDESPAIPAARSGLTDLKNVYGHIGGDSKDGDSPAVNFGYGDDSDSEDDSPGGAYGYGCRGGVYGYGGKKPGGVYGYGDDGGDGDDDKGADYGYGEDKDADTPAGDYGYGDEDTPSKPVQPKRARPRLVRRNSCVIHKEDNPLAVAEYLLGGPPRMSDRDMDMELNNEGAISA